MRMGMINHFRGARCGINPQTYYCLVIGVQNLGGGREWGFGYDYVK